jgi:putative serine protease PepD
MPSPTSLWTDPKAGDGHDWLASPPAPPNGSKPREVAGGPAPAPRGRPARLRRIAIGSGVGAALVAAALAGASLGGEESPDATSASLPAASGGGVPASRINEIYAAASEAVVSVQVAQGSGAASGTGFVIDADGTIVTNAHVVGDADEAQVRFDDDGRPVEARVTGTDPSSDLAVLQVDPSDVDGLRPLTLADSDDVRVGDTAVAIGYPLGLDRTATAGIVSGVGREIEAPNGFSIDEVIQTDAPINPGNSGGPLLDARGRVIGVNSQIATAGSNGNVGIGFAVPSNTVREVVPRIERGEQIERPYLGVSTSPSLSGDGAVVREVTADGPAERAGLQATAAADGSGGDVIVSIDGREVTSPEDVAAAIEGRSPGDTVRLEVLRDGERRTVTVELGERPSRAP